MGVLDTRSGSAYSVIAKPVSADCNLACDYCYYTHVLDMYEPGERRMSDEVLTAYTEQVIRDSGPHAVFSWQGGEPLLAGRDFYEGAFRVQRRLSPSGQTVANTIQTNGLLLDDDWCRMLRERNVLVGLSIDGSAAEHDKHRRSRSGKGSHHGAIRALELLKRHGVEFNVLVVVSDANARRGREVLRFLAARGVRWIQFIPCTERDADGNPTAASIDGPSFGRFLCAFFDEWYPAHVGVVTERILENVMQRAVGLPPELCVFSAVCGQAVVLEASGDVYACDHFVYPDFRLGSIMEQPLRELVRREPCQVLARAKLSLPDCCVSCRFQGLCYGGCPKSRFDPVTRTSGEPILCEGYRMLFEHAFERLAEMGWRVVRGQSPLAGA
jgi:uncharacterized protein